MDRKETFGSFLNEKRKRREISLRMFAEQLGISPVYMCNMEKDRNPAPSDDILSRMVKLLWLTDEETTLFFDLAAKSKSTTTVSQDLPEYIMERYIVRVALRTAKDVDAKDEEWQEFIAFFQNTQKQKTPTFNKESRGFLYKNYKIKPLKLLQPRPRPQRLRRP